MNTLTTLAILTLSTWSSPTSDPEISGLATYYRPDLMQRVAANRHMVAYEPPYLGGVALNRAGDLGRTVWLRWEDGTVDGPYRVVDCARRIDYPLRLAQGKVVEVDAETAKRHSFYGIGPVPVTVLFGEPEVWIPAVQGRYEAI